jgi:hypothetical protein
MGETIYKYVTAEVGALILKELTLKATRPDEFNDPFEFMPRTSERFDVAELQGMYQHATEMARRSEMPPPANYRETVQMVMANPAILRLIAPSYSAMCQKLTRTYNETIACDTGVICFSGRRDRVLMWSHYTDEHKGIVIGFDSSHFPKLFQVRYSKTRVLVNPYTEHVPGSQSESNYVDDLVSTKHEDWHYEEEYRQLHRLPKRAAKNELHTIPIPAECIVSVAVGMRYEGTEIPEAVAKLGSRLQLERAVPHPHEFTVIFEPFK